MEKCPAYIAALVFVNEYVSQETGGEHGIKYGIFKFLAPLAIACRRDVPPAFL